MKEGEENRNQEEFEKSYKDIFGGLVDFGKEIIFEIGFSDDEDEMLIPEKERIPNLISVNGCKDIREFELRLLLLKQEAIGKAEKEIKSYDDCDCLEYICKNIKYLKTNIRKSRYENRDLYFFRDFRIKDKDGDIYDIYSIPDRRIINFINDDYFVLESSEYATIWHLTINELEIHFKKFLTSLIEKGVKSKSKSKLKIKLSVDELAYLFRVMAEHKLFDVKYNTEIFNFIADSFETKGKDELSAKSIKNKFDNPDIKVVVFWDEKFLHFRQYTQKNK